MNNMIKNKQLRPDLISNGGVESVNLISRSIVLVCYIVIILIIYIINFI
jgi:hypothetical protein